MKVFANARVEVSLDDRDMADLLLQKALELAKQRQFDKSYLERFILSNRPINGEEKEALYYFTKGYGPYADSYDFISSDENVIRCFQLAKFFKEKHHQKTSV